MKDLEEISGDVVDVALRLRRELGPALLESVYEREGVKRIVNDYTPSASPRLRVNQPNGV